ncbi:MAG: serine/threonine-protein kinase HipA [Chlamydiales bacterium]|jgi:serine/threonine-protein kinase HipA
MRGPPAIEVCADWRGLGGPQLMGRLYATPSRGKEIFSFEYAAEWLAGPHRAQLDPTLGLYPGPQYPLPEKVNFGIFLDSSPDRWGRVLMKRREAQLARKEGREARRLVESDYLLGVHDGHRMGALRFRVDGIFRDDNDDLSAPPWTSLRTLEHASLQLEGDDAENEPEYDRWLRMLIAPGGSLGGARPKASVLDEHAHLWIAKFPSQRDEEDVGAWESVAHELAQNAGIDVPTATLKQFGSDQHTFLSRRFDRTPSGERVHFASALTLLERTDGEDAADGASYLEMADMLIRLGASTPVDLEQLWRRILFSVCISNTDDHLRNHGFLSTARGWRLAPAYDMNPNPDGEGLKLNISESDNAQDWGLVMEVAPYFRVKATRATEIGREVAHAVSGWRDVAQTRGLPAASLDRMKRAFRLTERRMY